MTMHTTITATADTQVAILTLMADGRERTAGDIATRLKIPVQNAKGILGHLVKANAILSERIESGCVYHLPQRKPQKPKAPRKAKAPAIELSHVAALNVATIERLVAGGAAYEDAYAYLWNKQPKRGKLPEMAPKHDYTANVQARVLALIEANPGVSAPRLRALANMSKSALSSSVQSLCVSGRAHMLRGNGRQVQNRYYPGARQQVAAE